MTVSDPSPGAPVHPGPTRSSGEDGNIIVLSIVLGAVVLALVLVFSSITQLQIERKRLLALTDATAAHAASAIDEDAYFAGAGISLTNSQVQQSAEAYLQSLPPSIHTRFTGLTLAHPTSAADAQTAQVTLSAHVTPVFIPWALLPTDGFTIEVTSAAQAGDVR